MARRKRVELVGEFVAASPDGRRHRLRHFRDILDVGTHDDPAAELPGLEAIKTADGRSVNRLEKGKYEIVGYPNIAVMSSDPLAP
jgi:hypothetical protein